MMTGPSSEPLNSANCPLNQLQELTCAGTHSTTLPVNQRFAALQRGTLEGAKLERNAVVFLEYLPSGRYSPAMAEPTDIESLARRLLDLWQEQLAAMAAIPEFVDSAERILNGFKPGQTERATGDPPGATDDATRISAARVSPDALGDGMRRLESHLAALE